MEPFITSLISKITDPYFLVLVAVCFGLMKMISSLLTSIEKRDKMISDVGDSLDGVKEQLSSNREVQSNILKLIEVLIYDRRNPRN